ncbi:Hypothetical predicted protein [Mytilus galloprovincialis]|uniref:Uncharacterized protein n=1 Tax=Mytilus galloprovincialis TaxID=29158 RepID=A0A8B6H145_MYTGA|nr:Hypothetical predicted protein [Mytilus galloprovincialis]
MSKYYELNLSKSQVDDGKYDAHLSNIKNNYRMEVKFSESLRKQRSEFSGKSGEGVTTNSRNNTLNRNTDNRKDQRKRGGSHLQDQSVDQRYDISNIISIPSSTNNEAYNKYLNTDEAQGEYFVLDPSVTKYHKALSNWMLPEIKRCSDAEGDENVYYEIDEDKIESSTDIGGVYQRKMEAVVDKDYHRCDQTRYETELGPKKKNTEQLTRVQSVDQKTKMTNLKSSPSNTGRNNIPSANKSLNTDIDQGDYFVLDPSVTKYDKHLSNRVLPKIKRFSVQQCDGNVYNEIDEDKSEPSTDM